MTDQRQKIMLVESDQNIAAAFGSIFSRNLDVIFAKTSGEALNKAGEVDLIVTGCILPADKAKALTTKPASVEDIAYKEMSVVVGKAGSLVNRLGGLIKTDSTAELLKQLKTVQAKIAIMTDKDVSKLQSQKILVEQQLEVLKAETENIDGETKTIQTLLNEAKLKQQDIEDERNSIDKELKTELAEIDNEGRALTKAKNDKNEASGRAGADVKALAQLEALIQANISAKTQAIAKSEAVVKEMEEAQTQADAGVKERQEALAQADAGVKEMQEALRVADKALKEKAELESSSAVALKEIADLESKLQEAQSVKTEVETKISESAQTKLAAEKKVEDANAQGSEAQHSLDKALSDKKNADSQFDEANKLKAEAEAKVLEQINLAKTYNDFPKTIDLEIAKIKSELIKALSIAETALNEKAAVEEKYSQLLENWESFLAGM
jgi:chromosome segregation ATPase